MTTPHRILLTGAGGFVGGHLAPVLAATFPNARRVALERRPGAAHPGWEALAADIVDEAAIEAALADVRPDLVVHLAAQASVGHSAHLAEATWRVNLVGTMNLAAGVARHAPQSTFLFASSAEVYGASFNQGPMNENSPLAPLNPYAASKAAAEHALRDILPPQANLIIARPFNHSGPGQGEHFALPAFAAQIARMEAGLAPPCLRVGNLDARRDFLDVRDVVRAYRDLIVQPNLPTRLVVNIGSGESVRVGDLLLRLQAMSRRPFQIEVDPERLRPSEIPDSRADNSRLRQITGWRLQWPLDNMLEALLAFWRLQVAN